jgi:hypothetical protein
MPVKPNKAATSEITKKINAHLRRLMTGSRCANGNGLPAPEFPARPYPAPASAFTAGVRR